MEASQSEKGPDSSDMSAAQSGATAARRCPFIPVELWNQIWQEAASIPRVVLMRPDTAVSRSIESPRVTVPDRLPPILHVNRLSRRICLPIYKHKLQVRGHGDLWETYFLADHDILALDDDGLRFLLSDMELYDANISVVSPETFTAADTRVWHRLIGRYTSHPASAVSRDMLTPAIENHLHERLQPVPIPSLRGDLPAIKRAVLRSARSRSIWPDLHSDPEILTNLSRAFPAVAEFHDGLYLASYAVRLAEAGVAPLPERYRCGCQRQPHPHYGGEESGCDEPMIAAAVARYRCGCQHQPHPHHAEESGCNEHNVAAAVARTPLDFAQWLRIMAIDAQQNADAFSTCRGHDLLMWWFKQPRYLVDAPLPEGAGETERAYEAYGAYLQTIVWGLWRPVVTVYESKELEREGRRMAAATRERMARQGYPAIRPPARRTRPTAQIAAAQGHEL